ncbi:sterol desaturase family protein [Flavobacteriaceae bacterium]|nr:sterol desaturase family protein [Flavobacteriaceae bacterium]MDA9015553.1 sterol desaturase family protein [Flavobacteriaceae bacterium]
MEAYAAVLLWAIPGFFILVIFEIAYGHFTKKQTYTLMDTLASLSSGMTNIIKDVLGLGLILVSYPFVLKHLSLIELKSTTGIYIIAFIAIDFASYWIHRLNHKINLFWNQHLIHHSSEEFNLACALRQSISNLVGFSALFLIPAAFLGIPTKVILTLSPLHLFAQFWYHTRHIGKLGLLEYILVTPSQHRVHHAINTIYLDKNLAAIFCVWDRIFGTFQEELDSEPPIYGTLKPAQSWNPIWINFQHFSILFRDAWYTKNWRSKFKIWFMATGWRPQDVMDRFPLISRDSIPELKYNPNYSKTWKIIALFHFSFLVYLLIFLLGRFDALETSFHLSYGILLMSSIFGFTALMDFHSWAPLFEQLRGFLGLLFLSLPQHQFLLDTYPFSYGLFILYFITTVGIGFWAKRQAPDRRLALN